MPESTVLERRPRVLEQLPETVDTEQMTRLVQKIYGKAKGIDTITSLPLELIISQIDHDDVAALIPLAFNQKIAASILGENYEPVLTEMFQHLVEFVAIKTDPGTWQSFVALIANPVIARQLWGPGYKQNLRQLSQLILEDLEEGQKQVSRSNGHRR